MSNKSARAPGDGRMYTLRLSDVLHTRIESEAARLSIPRARLILRALVWYLDAERDWDGIPLGVGMVRATVGNGLDAVNVLVKAADVGKLPGAVAGEEAQ